MNYLEEIADVKGHLKKNFIRAIKYHQTLEPNLQVNCFNQAIIELSADGKRLLITNRKPVYPDKYIYEQDPEIVHDVQKNA